MAVRSAESELVEIALHVLAADLDVRGANRSLEKLPEALNRIHVESFAAPIIEERIFLASVLHSAMRVTVASE